MTVVLLRSNRLGLTSSGVFSDPLGEIEVFSFSLLVSLFPVRDGPIGDFLLPSKPLNEPPTVLLFVEFELSSEGLKPRVVLEVKPLFSPKLSDMFSL